MTTERIARLRGLLERRFDPVHLEIVDESERHRGHVGAASGGGHFRVLMVAAAFRDCSLLERQRAVYSVLGDLLGSDVHALALSTLTPEEWNDQTGETGPGR